MKKPASMKTNYTLPKGLFFKRPLSSADSYELKADLTLLFITVDTIYPTGTQRIPVDISNSLQQVAVRVDENGLVATAEKLSVAWVARRLYLWV
jgi:hypothetical protein